MDNKNIISEEIVIENFQKSKGSIEVSGSSNTASTIAQDLSITEKIPRPRNAFILFRQHHHKILIDEWTGKGEEIPHNSKISKILGLKWKSLNDEERIYWEDMARKEKIEHEKKYPHYRYKPIRKHKRKQSKLFMEHNLYDNMARHQGESAGSSRNVTPSSLISSAPTPAPSVNPVFYRRLAIPRTDALVGNFISSSPANIQGEDEKNWKQVRPPQPTQQHFTNSNDIATNLSTQFAPVPLQLNRQSSNPSIQSNPPMQSNPGINGTMPFPFIDKTNRSSNPSKPNAYSFSPFPRQPSYPPVTQPLLASISPPQPGISPLPSSSSAPAAASVSVPRTQSGTQPSVSSPSHTILYPTNLQVQHQMQHQMQLQMQQQMQMQMEMQMHLQLQQQMQFQHQLQMQPNNPVDNHNHLPAVNIPPGPPEQVNEFAYQSSHTFLQPYSQTSALTRSELSHGLVHGAARGFLGTTKEIQLQPIAEYQPIDINSNERDIQEIPNENDQENHD